MILRSKELFWGTIQGGRSPTILPVSKQCRRHHWVLTSALIGDARFWCWYRPRWWYRPSLRVICWYKRICWYWQKYWYWLRCWYWPKSGPKARVFSAFVCPANIDGARTWVWPWSSHKSALSIMIQIFQQISFWNATNLLERNTNINILF